MGKVSISRAWEETKQVVARDGKLIATVAAAFIVLPGTISGLFQPETEPGQLPPLGIGTALTFAAMVTSLIGQIAIIRLAVGPSLSVGDAIRHGAQRFLPLLAAIVLVVAPLVAMAVAAAQRVGTDAGSASPVAALLLLILLPLIIYLVIRMMLAAPVASSERVGPIGIIARSWALTRGNWWRLFAFFLLWIIAALVILAAVGSVFGSLAQLAFGDIEGVTVGALIVGLAMQLVMAGVTVLVTVMLARIYVQLTGGPGGAEVSVPSSKE